MNWTRFDSKLTLLGFTLALAAPLACTDDGKDVGSSETSGDGDGDATAGDGDGDGDGSSGDGDGDGTSGDGDGDGSSGDGDGDGTSGDGDGDGDGDGAPIMCPEAFPSFDKTCTDVSECVIALHTINCCGTEAAIGINASALEAFAAAESVCDAQYPQCDCAPGPTQAEDGTATQDATAIVVDCVAGSCMTSVP